MATMLQGRENQNPISRSSPQSAESEIPIGPKVVQTLSDLLLEELLVLLRPIELYAVGWGSLTVPAATNIIPAPAGQVGLIPKRAPCTFRITANMQTAGVLSVQRWNSVGTTQTGNLNGTAGQLSANVEYLQDIIVSQNEQINLQYSVASIVNKLAVHEIDGILA